MERDVDEVRVDPAPELARRRDVGERLLTVDGVGEDVDEAVVEAERRRVVLTERDERKQQQRRHKHHALSVTTTTKKMKCFKMKTQGT